MVNEINYFKKDPNEMPVVRIKNIHFENFKAFEDVNLDFTENNDIKKFICFFGPNGCGKSTILETIQVILSKFEGISLDRLRYSLGKSVRSKDGNKNGVYGNDDFVITSDIYTSKGEYSIKLNKHGFISDHPQEIKDVLNRVYYAARFDQELHQFQLERSKWSIFKSLFESITGFTIEENEGVFSMSADPIQKEILDKYVLGFKINKPDEIITHKECSAGERKIIKSFSTLLNKEYCPQIIMIDNVEMHVESGRHLELIKSLKRSFSDSQLFTSTHSYHIPKNLESRGELYDLRFIKASKLIKDEPWRIYLKDEIKENILKINFLNSKKDTNNIINEGHELMRNIDESYDKINLTKNIIAYIQKIEGLYLEEIVKYYGNQN